MRLIVLLYLVLEMFQCRFHSNINLEIYIKIFAFIIKLITHQNRSIIHYVAEEGFFLSIIASTNIT